MPDITIISFDKQLKGLSVMNAETAWKVGTVADLTIEPAQGVVSGLLLTTQENSELLLPIGEGVTFKDSHLLNRSSIPRDSPNAEELNASNEDLPDLLRVTTDLLGASVVTEQGKSLGNINEVYLDPTDWRAFYHVTHAWWQRWLGGGIYIPASLTVRWSQTTSRLVVAAGTDASYSLRPHTKRVIA